MERIQQIQSGFFYPSIHARRNKCNKMKGKWPSGPEADRGHSTFTYLLSPGRVDVTVPHLVINLPFHFYFLCSEKESRLLCFCPVHSFFRLCWRSKCCHIRGSCEPNLVNLTQILPVVCCTTPLRHTSLPLAVTVTVRMYSVKAALSVWMWPNWSGIEYLWV